MKIRLYHSERKKDKEAVDAWSIYCPYPKKYRISTSIKGVFLGCKPTENGMVRCCWTEDEVGNKVYLASNPQPIGFSGILLAKRQNSFYCTYFLHNRNVADTKSPYPIKRLEVIRWFNQKSMVFNQSLS